MKTYLIKNQEVLAEDVFYYFLKNTNQYEKWGKLESVKETYSFTLAKYNLDLRDLNLKIKALNLFNFLEISGKFSKAKLLKNIELEKNKILIAWSEFKNKNNLISHDFYSSTDWGIPYAGRMSIEKIQDLLK